MPRRNSSIKEARNKIREFRRDYAKGFDEDPEPERRAFCTDFPALISKAAATLPKP